MAENSGFTFNYHVVCCRDLVFPLGMFQSHFLFLLALSVMLPTSVTAETWLRCEEANSALFPKDDAKPPFLEIDGSLGTVRDRSGTKELQCVRASHDPGLVNCHGVKAGKNEVLFVEFYAVATDQNPPVALSTVAVLHAGELISPPASSRIALICDINGFPDHPKITPKPRQSNPNPTWIVD
jgi:hypothetical protein